jgi:hypothetical protein
MAATQMKSSPECQTAPPVITGVLLEDMRLF